MQANILNIFKNIYNRFEAVKTRVRDWFIHYARAPHAQAWLSFFSFIESSIFPLPPDILLVAMILVRRTRWIRYAAITAIFSILGGIAGYFIGAVFFETIGEKIIAFYGLEEEITFIGTLFKENAFLSIFIAAFTPIPYKVFTLSAGFFSVNLLVFITASVIGRSIRFFAVSYIVKFYGDRRGYSTYRYFDLLTLLAVFIAVVLFFLLI